MSLEKEFVPYELAVKLKELGFDEWCFHVRVVDYPEHIYNYSDYEDYPEQKEKEVPIPLWQQAFDWFRDIKKLHSEITSRGESFYQIKVVSNDLYGDELYYDNNTIYPTYQESRINCLEKLIEIVSCKSEN